MRESTLVSGRRSELNWERLTRVGEVDKTSERERRKKTTSEGERKRDNERERERENECV